MSEIEKEIENDIAALSEEKTEEPEINKPVQETSNIITDEPAADTAGAKTDATGLEAPKEPIPEEPKEPGIFDDLYTLMFGKSWEMWIGCIILSVLSIGLFLIQSPWGSSGGLLNWGQNLFDLLGLELTESAPAGVTELKLHRYGMLSVLMLIGALGSALLSKEFAIRVPPKGEMVKGLLGGILMGIGAIIGMGCTIGNFYSGWPALSGGALIFVLGLFIGVFIAVKYLLWEMENHPGLSSGNTSNFLAAKTEGTSLQPLAGIIVLAIGAMFALMYEAGTEKVLIGFVIIGLMIGVVLQRSRFCIVRTLRETFLTGDSDPTSGLIAGLLVGLFGFVLIKLMGHGAEMSMVGQNYWMPGIVGGVVFGIGMTIAGGCTVGSTWRAGEGHVKLWFSMIGLILFLPLTAEYIKPAFMDALPDSAKQAIFLPDEFGYGGAICIMLLILVLWYVFVKWNERTGKFTAL